MTPEARLYHQLIDHFLRRKITATEFETVFIETFKGEKGGLPEQLFFALDRLFGDVDMFCADDELRDDEDLDEDRLRDSCKRALREIENL